MRLLALIFLVLFFLFCPYHLYAAEISFSNAPQIIQKDQEITLDVTVNGAAPQTTNYIRAAFYHPDSPTSYFGYIFNSSNNWYSGTPSPIDPKLFLQVQIGDEGSWNGQLKIKTDTESPYFKGNGQYYLKVGRYTASATSVSNWSQPVSIEIQGVLPSPTPTAKQTPTPKPISTSIPTKLQISQKNTQSPIQQASAETLQHDEDDTLQNAEAVDEIDAIGQATVLGITSSPSRGVSPSITKTPEGKSKMSLLFLISGAVILIIGCGILLISAYKKQKAEDL